MRRSIPFIVITNSLILAFLIYFASLHFNDNVKMRKRWETKILPAEPISAVYDMVNDQLFIAQKYIEKSKIKKNAFITKISVDGEILELQWFSNLSNPTSMTIFDGDLYVADVDRIVRIDLKSGTPKSTYKFRDKKLSDIKNGINGEIFAIDERTDSICRITENKFTTWFSDKKLSGLRSLFIQGDKLWVLSGTQKSIIRIKIPGKKAQVFHRIEDVPADIIRDSIGNSFLVSENGKKFFIRPNGVTSEILSNQKILKTHRGFLEYVPTRNMLILSPINENKIEGYELRY